MLNTLIDDTKSEAIKERFIDKVNDEVISLQKVFDEWIDSPNPTTKALFVRRCVQTNGMKTVITTIHDDIVSHKSGYYNDLLEGGVSYIQATGIGGRGYFWYTPPLGRKFFYNTHPGDFESSRHFIF